MQDDPQGQAFPTKSGSFSLTTSVREQSKPDGSGV